MSKADGIIGLSKTTIGTEYGPMSPRCQRALASSVSTSPLRGLENSAARTFADPQMFDRNVIGHLLGWICKIHRCITRDEHYLSKGRIMEWQFTMTIMVLPFMFGIRIVHYEELSPGQRAATFDKVDLKMIAKGRDPSSFHKTGRGQ